MKTRVFLGGLGILFGLLYFPLLWDMAKVWWDDPNYSHGLLIPLVSAYLIWNNKEQFSRIEIKPQGVQGSAVLLLALILRIIGEGVDFLGSGSAALFVKGISLIIGIAGLVLLLLGKEFIKALAFPLIYLVFMVPLPGKVFEMMTLPLQDYATGVTISALQIWGIPVTREGNLIILPNITLGVVEACSGIRSLFTLLALAGAFILLFMNHQKVWKRVVLFFSAIPIAVITNAFRVTITGLMAHKWGEEAAQGFYHDFSGWVIFIIAFILLASELFLINKLSEDDHPPSSKDVDQNSSGTNSHSLESIDQKPLKRVGL